MCLGGMPERRRGACAAGKRGGLYGIIVNVGSFVQAFDLACDLRFRLRGAGRVARIADVVMIDVGRIEKIQGM